MASSGYDLGMLLNMLQCSGQPLPFQRIIWSKMSIMLRLKNPVLYGCTPIYLCPIDGQLSYFQNFVITAMPE